ncbi:hypothetical protein, partial [Vibrio sp. PNB22_4_2]
ERIVCLRWVNFKSVLVGHFYIGADTPIITQLKASKLRGYGALVNVSFEQALKQVESVRA